MGSSIRNVAALAFGKMHRRTLGRTFGLALGLTLALLAGCAGTSLPPGATAPGSASMGPTSSPTSGEVPSAILATARSQLGAPYRFGGCDPRGGFDCSGFVYWVYSKNGVELPRISRDQEAAGRSVPSRELQPADLVFFRTGWRDKTTHVGIYAGQGRFIHSPSGGGVVREESLGLPYWSSRFVGARRVVWSAGELSEELRTPFGPFADE